MVAAKAVLVLIFIGKAWRSPAEEIRAMTSSRELGRNRW